MTLVYFTLYLFLFCCRLEHYLQTFNFGRVNKLCILIFLYLIILCNTHPSPAHLVLLLLQLIRLVMSGGSGNCVNSGALQELSPLLVGVNPGGASIAGTFQDKQIIFCYTNIYFNYLQVSG